MVKQDIVDIASAYNRIRLTLIDLGGIGHISNKTSQDCLDWLKTALLQDGDKKGLSLIKGLFQDLKRKNALKENHFLNLMKDLATMNRAEF